MGVSNLSENKDLEPAADHYSMPPEVLLVLIVQLVTLGICSPVRHEIGSSEIQKGMDLPLMEVIPYSTLQGLAEESRKSSPTTLPVNKRATIQSKSDTDGLEHLAGDKDKRAALLLDKIMLAVQKAIDENGGEGDIRNHSIAAFTGAGLDRRGSGVKKGVYWRC